MKKVGTIALCILMLLGLAKFNAPAYSEELPENGDLTAESQLESPTGETGTEQDESLTEESEDDHGITGGNNENPSNESASNLEGQEDAIADDQANPDEYDDTEAAADIIVDQEEFDQAEDNASSEEDESETAEVIYLADLCESETISGQMNINRNTSINLPMVADESAVITIGEGTLTIEDGQALENHGYIRIIQGTLLVKSSAALENYGIIEVTGCGTLIVENDGEFIAKEGGHLLLNPVDDNDTPVIQGVPQEIIESSLLYGVEDAVVEELLLSELLGSSVISERLTITQAMIVDQSVVTEVFTEMFIDDGTLTINEGMTFENHGFIRIDHGTLLVKSGATLENYGFIEVTGDGMLIVEDEGIFTSEEGSLLRLDRSGDDSHAFIQGIAGGKIELTVSAGSLAELEGFIHNNEYAFLTVVVSDPSLVGMLDLGVLGANKSISFAG